MLRRKGKERTKVENLKLGSLTAFSAGMVNVTSVVVFFSFTSNVTGHYAILAQELSKGNWYQAGIVMAWIFSFFIGNFISNLLIINNEGPRAFLGRTFPIMLEIACLLITGFYLEYSYHETLKETEILVSVMLFAMGLQNGLTASITNATVKTTHLTGLTTDLGILFSQFTKKANRMNKELTDKAHVLLTIMFSYLIGGLAAGYIYLVIENYVFLLVSLVLGVIVLHDFLFTKSFGNKQRPLELQFKKIKDEMEPVETDHLKSA